MKQLYILLVAGLCMAFSAGLSGQTIDFSVMGDINNRTGSLALDDQVNGKNSYSGTDDINGNWTVSWVNNRWEIKFQGISVISVSDANTSLNPPDFTTGNWQDLTTDMTLVRFDGSGTEALNFINFNNATGAAGQLSFDGEVNGRNSYAGNVAGSNQTVTISWSGTRWEINGSISGVLFFSNYDVAPNPPDFATGNWTDVIGTLTVLDGDGTQAVELALDLTDDFFSTTDGVVTGLGGGSPNGGVYSGPGVNDDGNGTTFSFDPTAAGTGNITISYGDGPDGANNVTQMVEVLNGDDVCVQEQRSANEQAQYITAGHLLGQNFTACSTGRINSVRFFGTTDPMTTIRLNFNRGVDTEGPDYTQEFDIAELGPYTLVLDDPFNVIGDSVYSFSIELVTGTMFLNYSETEVFAGGNAFQNAGSGIEQVPSFDMAFRLITGIDPTAVSTRPELDAAVTTLTASPNPASADFTVAYDLTTTSDVTVIIYDAQGRTLRTLPQGRQLSGNQRVNVNRAGLPAGVLYYGLLTERGHSAAKPIVLR